MKRISASAVFFLATVAANAHPLRIVNVGAPAINCVFETSCTVVVSDSLGTFMPPGDQAGDPIQGYPSQWQGVGRLQSRTYPGVAPAPAAGTMAYVYRVDMTSVAAGATANCVTELRIDFGPVAKEPYAPGGSQDAWVVVQGGLGSVGVASLSQKGSVVTFRFDKGGVCPGATSYIFGLASATATPPVAGQATLVYSQGGAAKAEDRVP